MFDGILIVDKEKGWTSHDVCAFIRSRFKIAKVGHGGTLDPMATGVLVILLGRATRMFDSIAATEKYYEGTIRVGFQTDTHDIEGKMTGEKSWDHISAEQIHETAKYYQGEIQQIPPMVSALKHKGVRLYKLARRGQEVAREARAVKIYEFVIRDIRLPEINFFAHVSKGTYVRTLAHDFGAQLGSAGVLSELRRLRSGEFDLEDAVTIAQLKKMDSHDLARHVRMSSAALIA